MSTLWQTSSRLCTKDKSASFPIFALIGKFLGHLEPGKCLTEFANCHSSQAASQQILAEYEEYAIDLAGLDFSGSNGHNNQSYLGIEPCLYLRKNTTA
jgi:hypothetical protein